MNSPEPALVLTAREREHLAEVILNLHHAALQEGMGIERGVSEEEDQLNRRRTQLHHHRSLDILYGGKPMAPVVPIESLAPSPEDLRPEGYGPPEDNMWLRYKDGPLNYDMVEEEREAEEFDRWVAQMEENYL